METIDNLCLTAARSGASDLYLHAGRLPQLRINNVLHHLQNAAQITDGGAGNSSPTGAGPNARRRISTPATWPPTGAVSA